MSRPCCSIAGTYNSNLKTRSVLYVNGSGQESLDHVTSLLLDSRYPQFELEDPQCLVDDDAMSD